MRKAVPILVFVLALTGCGGGQGDGPVTVENARVTLPAMPGRPGAAYFVLNTDREQMTLAAVTSPQIGRIELHETVTVGGFSRMIPLRNAGFNARQPLRFEPGGQHAMLFEVDPKLRPGDRVRLTFTFDQAPAVTVEAEARAAGDTGHGGH